MGEKGGVSGGGFEKKRGGGNELKIKQRQKIYDMHELQKEIFK
jgi:hypothetical protein